MGTFLFIAVAVMIAYASIFSKVNTKNKRKASTALDTYNWVTRNPERPLPKSKGPKSFLPKREEIEQIDLPERLGKIKLNTLAQITYSDAKSQISVRKITIKSIGRAFAGDLYVEAFCHECKEARTFKLSRIQSLIDIETGEIFANALKYFTERFEATPIAEIRRELGKFEDEFLVLTYMSRADGYMRKKEREIISEYVVKRSCNPLLDRELLDNEIRITYCEASRFESSIDRLKTLPLDQRVWLYHTAAAIVASEKKVDSVEATILEFIRNGLHVEDAELSS